MRQLACDTTCLRTCKGSAKLTAGFPLLNCKPHLKAEHQTAKCIVLLSGSPAGMSKSVSSAVKASFASSLLATEAH
jgi:hypothetical protein